MSHSSDSTGSLRNNLDSSRPSWAILTGLMLSLFTAALDATAVSTALPAIAADFHSINQYSWPLTAYLVSSTVMTLLCGGIALKIGHKQTFVSGIALFTLSSIFCATASTLESLSTWRFFEGLGGGLLEAGVFITVADLFEPRERGKWMGLVTSMYGLASIVGPVLGGVLTHTLGWRWIFLINLPIGLIALITVIRFLPRYAVPAAALHTFDSYGALFATLGIIPLTLAFSLVPEVFQWSSWQFIVLILGACGAISVLVFLETKHPNPLVPVKILRTPQVSSGVSLGFFSQYMMYAAIIFIPLYMNKVLGTDSMLSGLMLVPMVLALILGSAVAGVTFSKTGHLRKISMLSCIVIATALIYLSFLNTDWPFLLFVLATITLSFGIGMGMPLSNLAVQTGSKASEVGRATSFNLFFRALGGTVSAASVSSILAVVGVEHSMPLWAHSLGLTAIMLILCVSMPRYIGHEATGKD